MSLRDLVDEESSDEMKGPLGVHLEGEVVVNTDDPERAKEIAEIVAGILDGGSSTDTVVSVGSTGDVFEYRGG